MSCISRTDRADSLGADRVPRHDRRLPQREGRESARHSENHPYLGVIVKPTYDCNLACSYCSIRNHHTRSRMSRRTVDAIFERVTDFCGTRRSIYLIWHGGEPLLLRPDFYDYIGRKTAECGRFKIVNAVQTNATLLDDEFVDVLVRHDFRVSTSIDGPANVHNRSRRGRNGEPTFERVMESVALLKARGVTVGAITVLHRRNKDYMPEIYGFFNEARIHLRINPVQLHGNAAAHHEDVAISPREYGREMTRMFDIWYHDPQARIALDPFRVIIGNVVTDRVLSCDFRRQCHAEIISVGPDGSVYPCGQFNGDGDYYLGNINQETLDTIMASPGMVELLRRVPENMESCRRCEYVEICNCGCTASAVCRGRGILQPDYYCAGRKILFRHIIDTLEADVRQAASREHSDQQAERIHGA